jgi:hypothetical protein
MPYAQKPRMLYLTKHEKHYIVFVLIDNVEGNASVIPSGHG